MVSAEKVSNNKVIELIKIYNFYFGHFFIRESGSNTVHKIYISLIVYETIWEICKIYEQCYYHFLRWRNDQNKSYTSWWVVQLSCSWLFHMNSFGVSKCCLNLPFLIFKIWMVQTESHVRSITFMFMTFSSDIIWCLKILFELPIFWNSNFELYKQSHMKSFLKWKL